MIASFFTVFVLLSIEHDLLNYWSLIIKYLIAISFDVFTVFFVCCADPTLTLIYFCSISYIHSGIHSVELNEMHTIVLMMALHSPIAITYDDPIKRNSQMAYNKT